MLGRTANDLFWMARYIERAENMARLLEVGYRIALLPRDGGQDAEWFSTLRSAGCEEGYLAKYKGYLAETVAHAYAPAAAEQRFQAAHDLIKPYVIGPEGEKPGSTFISSEADFDAALAALIAHAKQRKQDVDAFLAP